MLVISSPPLSSGTQFEDLYHLTPIPAEQIGLFDVLCGRDKAAFNNIGNRRFRITVSLSLERYLNAPTRKDKSIVIKSVVTMVRKNGGRFLQLLSSENEQTSYIELNEKQSHEKAGHALRDMALLRNAKKTAVATKTTTKKVSTKDQPTIQKESSPEEATAETTTSMSSLLTNPRPLPIISSTTTVSNQRQQLPLELDTLADINWDESSDVTFDESIFDDLVQLVVDRSPTDAETLNSCDANVVHDSVPLPAGYPNVDDYYGGQTTSTNFQHMDSVSNFSSSHVEDMTRQTERRISTDSFAIDNQMLSWLVGESDFVLQI
jgi:hypothetical protein